MTNDDPRKDDLQARFGSTPVIHDLDAGATAAKNAARRRTTVQRSAAAGVVVVLLLAGFFIGSNLRGDDVTEIRTAEPDGQVAPGPTISGETSPPTNSEAPPEPTTDDTTPPTELGTAIVTIDVDEVIRVNDEVVDAETWLPRIDALAADDALGPDGYTLNTKVGTGSGNGCPVHTILDATGQRVTDHPVMTLSRCIEGEIAGWSSAGHVVLVSPTEEDAWSITVLAADDRSAQLTMPGAFQPQQLDVHTDPNGRTQALVLGTGEELVYLDVDAFLEQEFPQLAVMGISNETNLISARFVDGYGQHPYRAQVEANIEGWIPDPGTTVEPSSLVWAVTGVDADDTLNARSGAGTDFDVVFELEPDATGVLRTGNDATTTDGAVWFEIFAPTSGTGIETGWVNSAFLIETAVSDTRPCLFNGPQDHYIGLDWTNPDGSDDSDAAVISNIETYRFGGCLRTVIEFSDGWSYEDGGANRVTTLPTDIVVTRDNPPAIDFGRSITGAEVADARFDEDRGQLTFVSMGADRQLDGLIYGPTTTMTATFDNTNGTMIIDIADIRLSTDADPTEFDRVGENVRPFFDQSGVVLTGLASSTDEQRWTFTGLARPFEATMGVQVRSTSGSPVDVDWIGGVVDGARADNGVMTTTWSEAWGQFDFTITLPDDVDPRTVLVDFDPSGGAADDPQTVTLALAEHARN